MTTPSPTPPAAGAAPAAGPKTPGGVGDVVRKVVIGALLAVAAGLLWWGAGLKADPPDPSRLDAAIEVLDPPAGSPGVPRQQPIIVDLAPGWTGVLLLNGLEIPEDELVRRPELNQFSYQPGEGKIIEQLPPGRVVASAVIWQVFESRETGRPFTWTFRVS
ncbi:MAG: hypothetical protein AB7H43_12720 [Acidimicrobiia bacterium]